MTRRIVIATGGTGGHIFPAISLTNHLKNYDYVIELTTDKRGIRYLKDYDNISFKEIPSSPLIKKKYIKACNFYICHCLLNNEIFAIFNF